MIFNYEHVLVTSIIDGDTFHAEFDLGRHVHALWKVRLRDVRAVERKEPGGDRASALLEQLLPLGTKIVVVSRRDTYDRLEGDVFRADGLHVNAAQAEALQKAGLTGGR